MMQDTFAACALLAELSELGTALQDDDVSERRCLEHFLHFLLPVFQQDYRHDHQDGLFLAPILGQMPVDIQGGKDHKGLTQAHIVRQQTTAEHIPVLLKRG